MRVLLFTAFLALTPRPAAQNNAAIEGRVLRAGSSDPIPNVQVVLIKLNPAVTPLKADAAAALESLQLTISTNPELSQSTIDGLARAREQALGLEPGTLALTGQSTTFTDSTGHFIFRDPSPGRYTVRAVLDGFFGPPANGSPTNSAATTITVEAQKPVPAKDIFMAKGGIISGRIRGPDGQPASGVTVAAARVTYSNGRPQWTAVSSKATDDRGEYRIFWVGPGEYYVDVSSRKDTWATTFYPGVTDPTAATTLVIKDGSAITDVDFTIQATGSTGAFKITGTATNPLALTNPATGIADQTISNFFLSPHEPDILDSINPSPVQNALPLASRPNGEFEIRNIRPGSYDLIPYVTSPALRRFYIDRARVDVRNSDVEGVRLVIQKGSEIRGKVVSQGPASIPSDRIKVNLHAQDTIPEPVVSIIGAISVDTAGEFTATDIPRGNYSIQVFGLPATAYVSDIRQGGKSVFETGLTVGEQPVTSIEILVNPNGASIQGAVQTPDHKPAAYATVVLVPPAKHRQNVMMYKIAQADEYGSFVLKGVPPGDFTLYAWESVYPTAWMNAEFLAKYQSRGLPIVTTEGTHLDAQLDLISDDFNRR